MAAFSGTLRRVPRREMSHSVANVLNRVGIALGFLSFWFAAPEFVGQDRLQRWEREIANGLAALKRFRPFWRPMIISLPFFVLLETVWLCYIFLETNGSTANVSSVVGSLIGWFAAEAAGQRRKPPRYHSWATRKRFRR
jgi:hypothetical protein